jgi:hypothetical protein
MEQLRPPARLREDAAALRARLPSEVPEPDRRSWLEAQLVALETQAAALDGDPLPYLDHVAQCFSYAPPRWPDDVFAAAAANVDELLPGDGPLAARLAAWDARMEIPMERLASVAGWLAETFRATAARRFGLPEGEAVRISLVTGQPWGAYNWYDGGRRSRIDINTDLPVSAASLPPTIAHEAYPGHHLEHAWREADLVDGLGRTESSIILLNTPECLMSEGLSDLGYRFAVEPGERVDLLAELFDRAGLPLAADPGAAREAAELAHALEAPRTTLDAIGGNAAILRHVGRATRDEVVSYLVDVGRYAPDRAAKRLEFIDDPLLRTYVFVYAEGEALIGRWVDVVPVSDRASRFARLLHEQLTPIIVTAPG